MSKNRFYKMFENHNRKDENWQKIVEKLEKKKNYFSLWILATCVIVFALLGGIFLHDQIVFEPLKEIQIIRELDLTEKKENESILNTSFLKKIKIPFSVIETVSYQEYLQDVLLQNVVLYKGDEKSIVITFANNLSIQEDGKESILNGKKVYLYESDITLVCECKINDYYVKVRSENISKKDFISMIKSMI